MFGTTTTKVTAILFFYCKISARQAFCHTMKTRKNQLSWAGHAKELAGTISVKCARVFVSCDKLQHYALDVVSVFVAGAVYFLLMKRYPFKLSVLKLGPRHSPTSVKGHVPYADTKSGFRPHTKRYLFKIP